MIVLNYRYFHTDCSTFLKIKAHWQNKKKTLKHVFYRKIKKSTYINVYYLYAGNIGELLGNG